MAPPSRARFGDLERSVLEVLWARPEKEWSTVRDVHGVMARERDIAYTTVMTVMDRLARKELVERSREGRAYLYRARATRAAMTAELLRDTLDDFAEHDRRTALVAFVEEASPEDLTALKEALEALEKS
jgi:predicted transcriptional regulator